MNNKRRIPVIIFLVLIHILLIIFLLSSVSYASPPSGKKLLKSIQKAFNELESFSCTFTQEFQWSLAGQVEITEGTMELAKNDCFRFETSHQVMATDGKTLWRYSLSGKQVIIENLKDAEPGVLPREILFDFPKRFDFGEVKESVISGLPAYMITLVPKEDELGVVEVKVWIDAEDSLTRRMEWKDESGNRTTYILSDILVNPPIEKSRFSLQFPDEIKVYDLR